MKKLIFFGQRQIAWKALELLALPENREAIELSALITDLGTYERVQRELPVLKPRFIPNDMRRNEEVVAAIKEIGVNLLISVQHNWILSKEILEAVDRYAFNLHNARLPHYQGFNSISHSIINGDESYYSTLHWMEEAVDAGDIAYEEITPISSSDTALSLHRKTIDAALTAFNRLLKALRSSKEIPRRALEDVKPQFYERDSLKELLNVTQTKDINELERLARGLFYPPFNMAYFESEKGRTYLVPHGGLEDLNNFNRPGK